MSFEVPFLIFDRIELPVLKDLQTCLIMFPSLLPGFTKIPREDQNQL